MIFSEMTDIIIMTVKKLAPQKNFPIEFLSASGYGDEWGEDYINFSVVDVELRDHLWARTDLTDDTKTDYAKWTVLKLHVPKDFFNNHDCPDDQEYKRKFKDKWADMPLKAKAAIRVCNLIYETYPFWRKIVLQKHPELKI